MVNIQFLMSGKQFIVNAEAGSATTPALATKLTQDQRIAAFFAQTSQAAAAAKTARKGMYDLDIFFSFLFLTSTLLLLSCTMPRTWAYSSMYFGRRRASCRAYRCVLFVVSTFLGDGEVLVFVCVS